jgi:Fic family protein
VARVARVYKAMGVTYPTAKSDLKKLETLGILVEAEGISPIAYLCPKIIDVIYQD